MIPESFVQELLARVDIADVVGRHVQLRKGGANLLGLCPFHDEKTPSFTVSPTKQFYHCFGCGAHGSAITFLMQHAGMPFPEAVRSLAAGVGMIVPEEPRSPRQRAAIQRRKEEVSRQQQALDAAHQHYQKQLRDAPEAIAYLKKRGLDGETARHFGLGWSGSQRQGLASVFERYEDPVLVETGLVIEAEDGRRYDRFRDRIMFPIRNVRGKLIGFGGRIIGRGEPKYLNSPETSLFSKGEELYGLWEARAAIRKEGCVLVVEGYMDVAGLAQSGLRHAVATLGTATTPAHVQKLVRSSERIVFSFDGDAAGRRAAWKALQICLPLLRDDVSVRFLFLPGEHDPDTYVREFGAAAFRAHVAEAMSLSAFLLEELQARHDMAEPEGRAACMVEAAPLLAALPTGALRLQIEREFARVVRLTPEELGAAMKGMPAPPSGTMPEQVSASGSSAAFAPDAAPVRPRSSRERRGVRRVTPMAKRLVRLLLAHPELAARLGDQQLEILDIGPHLHLVRDLITLVNATGARHVGAMLEAAEPGSELAELLRNLTTELLTDEDLPDPQSEWDDALRRIELSAIKAEQSVLIETGLPDEVSRKRYQDLNRRMALLNAAKSV